MTNDYDSYNYPQYWETRKYEDQAEKEAIKKLFKVISKKGLIVDIGAGYGRLSPTYTRIFNKCLLVDPSEKLLKLAKTKHLHSKNFQVKKGSVQKLPIDDEKFDVALMVRVSHHLTNLPNAFKEINRILKPGGYLILEFANKVHFKSSLRAILRGKLDYLFYHIPKDISSLKGLKFLNYHPSHIKSQLLSHRFKIIKTLSVSNFRNSFIKKIIPFKFLIYLESFTQNLLAPLHFGPSIFILAQKSQ